MLTSGWLTRMLKWLYCCRYSHGSSTGTNIAEQCMARFANHMHLTHHKEFFEDVGGKEGALDVISNEPEAAMMAGMD